MLTMFFFSFQCYQYFVESLNFVLSIMYIYYKRLGLGALTRAFRPDHPKQQIACESDSTPQKWEFCVLRKRFYVYLLYLFSCLKCRDGIECALHCCCVLLLDVTWGYILNFGENTEEPTI